MKDAPGKVAARTSKTTKCFKRLPWSCQMFRQQPRSLWLADADYPIFWIRQSNSRSAASV
jgi:hypothetical protein